MDESKKRKRVPEKTEKRAWRKKRSADTEAKLESKVTQPALEHLGAEIAQAVKKIPQDYPRGNDEDFKALIPKRDEDDLSWTDEQEEEIKALVGKQDSLANELCRCPPPVDGVWRTCFRFLHCLASDIVGRRNRLVYGTNRGRNAFWSDNFCNMLHYVMLHPHFRKCTSSMGLALQWAVICRTDDRRKHCLNGCEEDVFLMILQDVIRATAGKRPVVQLEVAHLLYKTGRPPADPPLWYQLLVNIEVLGKRQANSFKKLPKDVSQLYVVVTEDVSTVLESLDEIRHLSLPHYYHHTTYGDAVSFTRSSDDAPTKQNIKQAIEAVVLSDLRDQKKQESSGPSIPDSPRRRL